MGKGSTCTEREPLKLGSLQDSPLYDAIWEVIEIANAPGRYRSKTKSAFDQGQRMLDMLHYGLKNSDPQAVESELGEAARQAIRIATAPVDSMSSNLWTYRNRRDKMRKLLSETLRNLA